MKTFKLSECQDLTYYGSSDLLAQLSRELQCNPDSCISKDVLSWYSVLYSTESEFNDCRYRIDKDEPSSLEDVIDLISAFVSGQNRRIALVSIRIICREVQRRLTESTAPRV